MTSGASSAGPVARRAARPRSGPSTVSPAAGSAAATGSGLASTGAEVTALAGVALLLLGAGTVAVLRRRRLAQG